ncbi:MarR family transcriptional regulator [Microlunatus elymi]|uniref:MarR family transcriptional regulator n=1 Tax=Microlunatus elymi TaxID=2596828 RepID=A0A516Q324_9ACTN|nr:MarR family transcriptional regulator [Microlunatus elymi]QDP97833.1 MarR family transcriptional regulator [Microlunatus elymi]
MSISFGPELVGTTAKTLQVLLRRALDGTELTEPQWVTLRLAGRGESADADALVAAARDRAHFENAADLVETLTARDLLADGALTESARTLMAGVRERTAALAGGLWEDLPAADVAATERILNTLLERGREVLSRAA